MTSIDEAVKRVGGCARKPDGTANPRLSQKRSRGDVRTFAWPLSYSRSCHVRPSSKPILAHRGGAESSSVFFRDENFVGRRQPAGQRRVLLMMIMGW